MKTGSGGRPWIDLERPKPARVEDRYAHWLSAPPEQSRRCTYWVRQIERGWLPNRRIAGNGYDTAAGWYGVWIWEYLNVLVPLIAAERGRGSGA